MKQPKKLRSNKSREVTDLRKVVRELKRMVIDTLFLQSRMHQELETLRGLTGSSVIDDEPSHANSKLDEAGFVMSVHRGCYDQGDDDGLE